jgi:hypothetical protein
MPARDRITELRFQEGLADASKAGWSRWDLDEVIIRCSTNFIRAGGLKTPDAAGDGTGIGVVSKMCLERGTARPLEIA